MKNFAISSLSPKKCLKFFRITSKVIAYIPNFKFNPLPQSLNYLEFKRYLPTEIVDEEHIEDIIQMLNDMGVEIRMEKAEVIKFDSKRDARLHRE